jgi:hypothetical protein
MSHADTRTRLEAYIRFILSASGLLYLRVFETNVNITVRLF